MHSHTKAVLLAVLSTALFIGAVLCLGFAIHLIRGGAYPPAGGGSLGHVGMVIAGLIAAFLAILAALLALYAGIRARAARRISHP
jgi:hypothetical protein